MEGNPLFDMPNRKRQRGALLILFVAFLAAGGLLLANLQLASANFSDATDPPELTISKAGRSIRDLLLANPNLWDFSEEENLTNAIHTLSTSNWLGENVLIHPSAVITEDNISYRNFVVCENCEDATPFDENGNYNDEAMEFIMHYSIDGYALQREGIFLARKTLDDLGNVMIRAYSSFAQIDAELDLCEPGKDRGGDGCNYFRGCDFNRGDILPCSETHEDGHFQLADVPLLAGNSFVIWGGRIFVKNSCDKDTEQCRFVVADRGHEQAPLLLTATGPLSTAVRLIVPEPNL